MGKGKPRHNPDKPANKRGAFCSHTELVNERLYCMYEGFRGIDICKGNPHNCMKVDLTKQASLSEGQRSNDVYADGVILNGNGNLHNPY